MHVYCVAAFFSRLKYLRSAKFWHKPITAIFWGTVELPVCVAHKSIGTWKSWDKASKRKAPIECSSCCSVFIVTDYGRPSGTAFVEFATPEDAQAAMAKDRQMMGTRYIEIFGSTPEERARYTGYV